MAGGKKYVVQEKNKTISENERLALEQSWDKLEPLFAELGIGIEQSNPAVPKSSGVPRVFLVKDGKVSTLEENGLQVGTVGFGEAMMRGEVFAFPAGSKEAVQLQLTVDKNKGANAEVGYSEPLKQVTDSGKVQEFENAEKLAKEEPERKPKPKWYHRAFQFWGSNRQICEDYEKAEQAHKAWEEKVEKLVRAKPEQNSVARAVEDQFGAFRTEVALKDELKEKAARDKARQELEKRKQLVKHLKQADRINHGIEVIENIYAAKPVIREEFTGKRRNDNDRDYVEEDFKKLTTADIDLSKMQIGGKAVTEKEFAHLGMFAAHDPEIGMQNQKAAVADPAPIVAGCKQLGYTEQEAKEIVTASSCQTYSMDILHKDSRMFKYFDAVNAGRDKAAEAVKEYQEGKKEKLAEILSRAVEHVGYQAGVSRDLGMPGYAKLGCEAIDIMKRDQELYDLAKKSYEERDKGFCDRHQLYKHRSFEQLIRDTRAANTLGEIEQKGLDGESNLLKATTGDIKLTAGEKKGYIKDVLRANLVDWLVQKDTNKMGNTHKETAQNKDLIKFQNYVGDLSMKIAMQDEEADIVAQGGGSSLPTKLPSLLTAGLSVRAQHKAPTLYDVTKPEWMAQMDQTLERIVKMEGLDKMTLDELSAKLVLPSKAMSRYGQDKIIELANIVNLPEKKTEGPAQQKQVGPEKNQADAEKNQADAEKNQADAGKEEVFAEAEAELGT